MEESDELLKDGAVGHSVPLESFETERNANDPNLKSDEIKQQGDGSCNMEERSRETINRHGKETMDGLEECQPDEAEPTAEDNEPLRNNLIEAVREDDVERLKEIIGKGPSSATEIACGQMPLAVDEYSVNCFEYLCDAYEQLTELSRAQVTFWGKNSPLITIVEHCNWVGIRIVEKHADLMNYLVDEPTDSQGSTPLLIAIKKGYVEVAKWLINKPGMKPDIEKRNNERESPIYLAALKGQAEIIKEMLEIYSCSAERRKGLLTNENLYEKGHSIFYPASQSRKTAILDVLMEEENASLFLQRELQHTESEYFIIGSCLSGSEKFLKAMLELNKDLPIQSFKDEKGATPLMRMAEAGRLENVKIMTGGKSRKNAISMCDNNGRNVFHYGVMYPEILMHLLKSFKLLLGYITSEKDLFGMFGVGYTNVEILRIAVEEWQLRDKVAVSDFLHGRHFHPLEELARIDDIKMMQYILEKRLDGNQTDEPCPADAAKALSWALMAGNFNCVELLIKTFPGLIDQTYVANTSALGLAFELGKTEIVKLLLNNGAKMTSETNVRTNMLKQNSVRTKDETLQEVINFCAKYHERSLKQLIKDADADPDFKVMPWLVERHPSVAVKVLDQCIRKPDRVVVMVYDFFPLMSKETHTTGKLEAIESMVKHKRDECLGHPLVVKFLNQKLNSSSVRLWITGNILLYAIFLAFLTTYTGLQTTGSFNGKSHGLYALSFIILAICIINIIKEIFQVKLNGKKYFHHLDNYIEWTAYISAVAYVIPSGQQKSSFQIATGAIAIFLSWINFMWFMKSFSLFGIYIIMAKKVFLSICKVLPMVLLFIVAFAMAFSVLMPQDQGFTSIPISLLTTFVMMTGEVDYRDTFLGNTSSVGLHYVQKWFLVIFLILVTIGLTNLLTGLAVGDTAEIMKRARQEKLLHKANLVITLEHTLHNFQCLSPPTVDEVLIQHLAGKETGSLFTRLWEAVYEADEVSETRAHEIGKNTNEKREARSRLRTVGEKNALSEKYEIKEKSTKEQLKYLSEQLSRMQGMLETLESNVGAAVIQ